MRVLLLGATGRLGSQILEALIEKEIHTTAIIRNPEKIKSQSKYLKLIKGDVLNPDVLKEFISKIDVIINTLNISRNSDFPWSKLRAPRTLISDTMKILVELIKDFPQKKIISVSAWGVNESRNMLPWWFKWTIDNSNIKFGYEDHERQEKVLLDSDVKWTIIRPVGLTNSRKNVDANVSAESLTRGLMVSRKTVAQFIVDQIESDEYINKIVTIS